LAGWKACIFRLFQRYSRLFAQSNLTVIPEQSNDAGKLRQVPGNVVATKSVWRAFRKEADLPLPVSQATFRPPL
jgi:hypothetical protein